MKRKITTIVFVGFVTCSIFGQILPTNTSPAGAGPSGSSNNQFWSRAGNSGGGANAQNNIFGTLWNSPIYTRTNGANRTKLNGTFGIAGAPQYGIDLYTTFGTTNTTLNTSGYMLLGPNAPFQVGGGNIYDNRGAYSLLHLNGTAPIQQNGYRPWMKTGITFTDNQDMSYFGLRQVGTALDWTETVMNWSDNQGAGEDDMCFRFTGASTSSTTVDQTNLRTNVDLDGLHIARYTANGRFGLGNTFGLINAPGHPLSFYVSPQSLFHMSYDHQIGQANEAFGFMQITYRRPTTQASDIIGQGEAETDGLRFGIDNEILNAGVNQHLDGYLRWQEASSFVIQTEDNTAANIQANERMRITSVGALALNFPATTYIGLTTPAPVTRIGVSHNGTNGLTRPMSLMHLGYNIGGTFGPLTLQNGWRSWMDLGMLISNNTDNVWIGMKPRVGTATATNNEMDAVISWGNDAEGAAANAGIDVMSFIYTADPITPLDSSVAVTQNGLEIARMYPGKDSTFTYLLNNPTNFYGRLGVGDFTATGVNEQPTHKLDVIGNGRFRYLPDSLYIADSAVNKIVMVDSMGVLRWSTFVPSTFGTICSDAVNSIFTEHRKVNLNDNNFYFEGNSDTNENNNVGFGWACGTPLKAKVDAIQYGEGGIGGSFMVFENWQNGINNMSPTGVLGVANGNGNGGAGYIGVNGLALGSNSAYCYGIYGSAGNSAINRAGFFNGDVEIINGFLTSDQQFKTNPTAISSALKIVSNLNPKTYYFDTLNFQQFNFGSEKQYGFIAQEVETVLPELVHNSIHPGEQDAFGNVIGQSTTYKSLNYNAIIPINTQAIKELNNKVDKSTLSDQTIKTNVTDLYGSLEKVLDMRGVTYDWDGSSHPNLVLDSVSHVGFIAQEIYAIDPLLTFVDEDTLMHVEYDKIVPILAEAISELNETVVAQDSIIEVLEGENLAQQTEIDDLNDRLTQLENCLSGILPFLCQMNNSAIQPTQEIVQEQLRAAINVNLSDRNAIVLNQNVPNPFAESTTITYSIPTSVQKAQIHFYDGQGKLINSVDIIERGNGQLNVFANDLSTGVYTYSLVADGQIVSTKRMVKE